MKLLLIYKDFRAANPGVSHVGLGVTSKNTAAVLKREGIDAESYGVISFGDIVKRLSFNDVTHCVIGAPWVSVVEMETLITTFKDVKFARTSHSNFGFLAAEPPAIKLLRGYKELQDKYPNFTVAGNCDRFTHAWGRMYNTHVLYLPNLYNLEGAKSLPAVRIDDTLRIGIFGSIRPLKNFVSAVAACIDISTRVNKKVDIYLSSGRDEGHGALTNRAIDELVIGLPNVKLIRSVWRDHSAFRQLVGSMDLLMQPSYTETFNMVSADGVAEGVPSVVSEVITWTPRSWIAPIDDVGKIAWTGLELLLHRGEEALAGLNYLQWYVADGLKYWRKWLND